MNQDGAWNACAYLERHPLVAQTVLEGARAQGSILPGWPSLRVQLLAPTFADIFLNRRTDQGCRVTFLVALALLLEKDEQINATGTTAVTLAVKLVPQEGKEPLSCQSRCSEFHISTQVS